MFIKVRCMSQLNISSKQDKIQKATVNDMRAFSTVSSKSGLVQIEKLSVYNSFLYENALRTIISNLLGYNNL